MAFRLEITSGPDKGRVFPLGVGETLKVGRSQQTPTALTDPRVSRVHCELEAHEDGVSLTDCGSAGGTFVNNKRVTQHKVRSGDTIQIGETHLRVIGDGGDEQPTIHEPVGKNAPAVAPEALDKLVGQIFSHYTIKDILARGQTGMIFRATDTRDGQDIALKVLQPSFSQDEEEKQRFIRAMKTMLPLRHENLVTIYNAGKTGSYCWTAMELVEGDSLAKVIQRIGIAGMLDWRYALRVAIHIARALSYAGEHQIIHRNLTSQNVLVRSTDKVAKLGDLMLAKALEGTMAQQITRPGELVGDINYMSPERTRGLSEVDCRSDIYGLGALVYALLTGRPPCAGASLTETIMKIRQTEPEPPRKYSIGIPSLFEGSVMRMLAKRPDDRHQTAAELLADLERVAKFQGVTV